MEKNILRKEYTHMASQVALVVKNPPANAGDTRDSGSIPGSGRSPGGGPGNPLQYSCLENLMNREAWQAIVHRFTKSWTRPMRQHTQRYIYHCVVQQKLIQHCKSTIHQKKKKPRRVNFQWSLTVLLQNCLKTN